MLKESKTALGLIMLMAMSGMPQGKPMYSTKVKCGNCGKSFERTKTIIKYGKRVCSKCFDNFKENK